MKFGEEEARILVKLPASLPKCPCAGDVVRMVAPGWKWGGGVETSLGMIGGILGKPALEASITFNFSAHVDDYLVSCSGGPGTISTDLCKLRPTTEVVIVKAWRFRDGYAGAGRGVDYRREARVWEWDGN
jgi:hypothetical protein